MSPTVKVSSLSLQEQLIQAHKLLADARYKQAIRLYDAALQQASALIDRLHIQAERAYAHALWKKPEDAIEDASAVLWAVQADTPNLSLTEIDWEHERAEDIGHLAFLADVYQLRGVMFLVRQAPRRAVEDFSVSILMSRDDSDNTLNYLFRAIALIELDDCLERALHDLQIATARLPNLSKEWFHLPAGGQFLLEQKVLFQTPDKSITLTPEKVRLKINRLQADWFRFAKRVNLP